MPGTLREGPGILSLRPAADPKRPDVTPQHRPDATADLTAALRERVLVLDGAMGTMIQRHRFSEADYRGERFADWATRPAGQQRPASLTQPDDHPRIHRDYLEAGADLIETNTFNAQRISLADYGMEDLAYEMNLAAAGSPGPRRDAVTEPRPTGPARCRRARPDQPDRVHLARRQRPRRPQRHLRPARRGLPGAGPRPGRRAHRRHRDHADPGRDLP